MIVSDASFGDVTARVKFRIANGNSGFFVRTDPETLAAYEVEIDSEKRTGGLWEVRGRNWVTGPEDNAGVMNDHWNDLTASLHGARIVFTSEWYEDGGSAERYAGSEGRPSRAASAWIEATDRCLVQERRSPREGKMNLDDLISRCTNSPDERWDICAELYNALDAGSTEPIDLAPYSPSFALFWRDVDEQVRPFQRHTVIPGAGMRSIRTPVMKPGCCWTFLAMFRGLKLRRNCERR